MKKSIIIIFFLPWFHLVFAQQFVQTIRGRVIDSDTKSPMVGATIILIDSNPVIGTVTDNEGCYVLKNISVGRQSFKISYVGYEDKIISNIIVISGKETIFDIELKEKVIQGEEVVVKASRNHESSLNPLATNSVRQFTVEETQRYAGGFFDPARMAGAFAGVSSMEGETNEIVIRGNSPRGLLWRLEGVEIPSPNHFRDGEGASGGGVNIITSNVISNSDFFTGAFPAEYGNALSGVFDIQLRRGNPAKREYTLLGGVVGFDGAFEGPFSKNSQSSYLINYRYCDFSLLDKIGIKIGNNDIAPKFQDLTINFNFITKKIGTFSAFGIGGISASGDIATEDSTKWKFWDDKVNFWEYHRIGVAGLKHFYLFSDQKTYIKTIITASDEYNSETGDTLGHYNKITNSYNKGKFRNDIFDYPTLRISSLINHKINAKNSLRSGIIFSSLWFSMLSERQNWSAMKYETVVKDNGNSYTFQAYANWQHRPTENIDINTGLHFLYFGLNGNYSVEPRLGARWRFAPNQALSIGFGIHSRVEPLSAYYTHVRLPNGKDTIPNKHIDFSRAVHNVIGYDLAFSQNVKLKVEAYFQYLYNVPQSADTSSKLSAINFINGLAVLEANNKGKGYNYGIEFTLEKYFSENFYYLVTLSLFESKFKAPDGKIYNTFFNGNYILNVLGGKEFVINQKNTVGINSKFIIKGGNRITPVNMKESRRLGYEVDYDNKYLRDKVSDFIRLDAGINYRRNKLKYSWELSLDVQNVTNRKNIFSFYYSSSQQKLIYNYYLGLIPILNFKIMF